MLALSPQFCSYGWMLDDPTIVHEQENVSREGAGGTSESTDLHSPSTKNQPKNEDFATNGSKTVKKLNHNASERDRRKKMNTLYANLRSLLPPDENSKKLSIPMTVSRALKYIPELQNEVERLIQEKDRLLTSNIPQEFKNYNIKSAQYSFSATPIGEGEIIIQTSIPKAESCSFSEAIFRLEEEDFQMAQDDGAVNVANLREKVWPFI